MIDDAGNVERSGLHSKVNGRGKGEDAPCEGEEEKLSRRPAALSAAPDPNEEKHRHQRQLEKDIEEQQVAGHKHAEHRHQQRQHPRVVFVLPDFDPAEAGPDRQGRKKRGENDEPDADRIHAQVKAGADRADRRAWWSVIGQRIA